LVKVSLNLLKADFLLAKVNLLLSAAKRIRQPQIAAVIRTMESASRQKNLSAAS